MSALEDVSESEQDQSSTEEERETGDRSPPPPVLLVPSAADDTPSLAGEPSSPHVPLLASREQQHQQQQQQPPPRPYASHHQQPPKSATTPVEIPAPDGTERGQFLHNLYSFMARIGQPIVKTPYLGYQELDLYRLYQIVVGRGGMDEVTRKQAWKAVYQELGIPTMSTSASYNTRTNYKKHLYLYELEHSDLSERRPPGREPRFAIGEYIRIVSPNFEGRVFYGKVVKCRWREGRNSYYIHYNGWSNSHDEWIPEEALSRLLPEETQYPQRLVNPQPTRSSKSNNIIGSPPSQHVPRSSSLAAMTTPPSMSPSESQPSPGTISSKPPRRSLAVRRGDADSSETTGHDDSDAYSEGGEQELTAMQRGRAARGSRWTTFSAPPEEGGASRNKLRLKLRHRPDASPNRRPPSDQPQGAAGPNLTIVQAEMDKLEGERFLEYVPPRRPKVLNEDNLHSYSCPKAMGRLPDKALKLVDLRVPDLGELVGKPPGGQTAAATTTMLKGDRQRSKTAELLQEEDAGTMPLLYESTESIRALEKELQAIKKEYRRKKHLLDLYYGPSASSSSSSNGGDGGASPTDLPDKGPRQRPHPVEVGRRRRMRL